MTGPYFTALSADTFLAGAHAVGPWDAKALHGGPVAALLARAIEAHATTLAAPPVTTRFTVELHGSVPLDGLTLSAATVRPGKRIELIGATLRAGPRVVAEARSWRVARGDTSDVVTAPSNDLPPLPAQPERIHPSWAGYLHSVEWRFVHGEFGRPGPATLWGRPLVSLVDAEPVTPLQRVLLIADTASGASAELPFDSWLFINTELTVHLTREPAGDWIGMDARTSLGPVGAGRCLARLFDRDGQLGHSSQALLVTPR